jgi:GTP cyclohydrolase II
MTHVRPATEPPAPDSDAVNPGAAVGALRAVHRAIAELRRGVPVVLAGGDPLALLAADTASAGGLAEFDLLRAGPALLLLAGSRAAAWLPDELEMSRAPVALAVTEALFNPAALRTLADPTLEQILPEPPALAGALPAAAPAALALTKLARLLPAALVAPWRSGTPGTNLSVDAADVLAYPVSLATQLHQVAEAAVPLAGAENARIVAFRAPDAGIEHLAILIGDPASQPAPLTRLHSECFTGDLLGSLRCDCGDQLRGAIARMGQEGHGVLLYLAQEGRGIGLVNKLRAYAMQDRGLDTLDANRALGWGADERRFLTAAAMLEALGIPAVRLLTNNPKKLEGLAACGITVVGREAHIFAPNGVNDGYLDTKAKRFGHLFNL